MPNPKPKTNAQVRRMFGLAKPLAEKAGMEPKEYIEQILSFTNRSSLTISKLSFDEANAVIKSLGGDPFPSYGHSRRMENYRKQQAGVETVETDAQLRAIRELAAGRGIGDDGLDKLATRMNLPWPPNTTKQGNKIFEALKKMNERDAAKNNVAQFPGTRHSSPVTRHPASEPSFRRVA